MVIENLTLEQLNQLHFDLSFDCSTENNLNKFYKKQHQMLIIRKKYKELKAKQPTMKQLFTYTVELWYRHGNDDKEFVEVTIVAENDEIAKELGKNTRRNIFKVEIKSKENYVGPKI